MPLDPQTKLAEVREAMARSDWESAIRVAAKFRRLGRHSEAIRRARDALNNPEMYRALGHDLDETLEAGIIALKERFSNSWESVESSGGSLSLELLKEKQTSSEDGSSKKRQSSKGQRFRKGGRSTEH